jgi:Fe2+ transport system protein B
LEGALNNHFGGALYYLFCTPPGVFDYHRFGHSRRQILWFGIPSACAHGTLLYRFFVFALIAAALLSANLKLDRKNFFMVEMPTFKTPQLKNVGFTVFEKTKSFVFGAGQVILALSIVIWFLGSNGYSDDFKNAETIVAARVENAGE